MPPCWKCHSSSSAAGRQAHAVKQEDGEQGSQSSVSQQPPLRIAGRRGRRALAGFGLRPRRATIEPRSDAVAAPNSMSSAPSAACGAAVDEALRRHALHRADRGPVLRPSAARRSAPAPARPGPSPSPAVRHVGGRRRRRRRSRSASCRSRGRRRRSAGWRWRPRRAPRPPR